MATPTPVSVPAVGAGSTKVRVAAMGLLAVFIAAISATTMLGGGVGAGGGGGGGGSGPACPSAAPSSCASRPTALPGSSLLGPVLTPILISPPPTTPPVVTFDEEFSGSKLDDLWSRNWPGFGDTAWVKSQARVANGLLSITAVRSGSGWLSDEVDTADTFRQLYGTFSARIRIPAGDGVWPAFWIAQPPNPQGQLNEIDIMEVCWTQPAVAANSSLVHNFVHQADGSHAFANGFPVKDLAGSWHVYTLDWQKAKMTFSIDGSVISRVTDPTKISSVPMAVAFDLAVGAWCAQPDETTPSPMQMQVDWVRVTR